MKHLHRLLAVLLAFLFAFSGLADASVISRQHSSTIINGLLINASDLSDEFNSLITESNAQDTRLTNIESGSMVISGAKTLSGNNTHSGTNTFSGTVNHTGQANFSRTTDPGTPVNGDIWYNSTGNAYKGYRNGATKSFLMTGDAAAISAVTSRSSNTVLAAADNNVLFVFTSSFTQTLTAAATLGSAWSVNVRNDGTGVITVDPNASETIDGNTTINIYPGEAFTIVCDGSNFKTVGRRKGLVMIQQQTASSSASVDFTTGFSDAEFTRYQLEWDGLVTATDNTNLWLRISQDGGSTYKSGASDYAYNVQFNNTGTTLGNVGSAADTKIVVARNLDTTATGANSSGKVMCFNLQSTSLLKNFRIESSTNADASSDEEIVGWGKFALNTNTAINGLRLIMASGNIASGTITLWGVRK